MKLLVVQNEACEPLGVFEDGLEEMDVECRHVRPFEEAVPKNLDGCSGLIILGGPMNVYQEREYPFLGAEDALIKEALEKNLPTLGICLGAQLIAKAAGAQVRKGSQKEIGWYEIRLTEEGKEDPVFGTFEEEFRVFQWHGDTFDIPDGAVKLAENGLYNQAFRIKNAYALQFHIEVTEKMIKDWIQTYDEEVRSLEGRIDPGTVLEDTRRYAGQMEGLARRFISRFLNLALTGRYIEPGCEKTQMKDVQINTKEQREGRK